MKGYEENDEDLFQSALDGGKPLKVSEEVADEISALTRQIAALKDMVKKSQAEVRRLQGAITVYHEAPLRDKQRLESLQRTLKEKDVQIHHLEEFKVLYQRAQEHVHQIQLELQEQKVNAAEEQQNLFLQIDILKSSLKSTDDKHQEHVRTARELQEENNAYTALLDGMREELTRLQTGLEEAQQTARDAEARHQTFLKEKTDLLDQLERSRHQLLASKDELRTKEEQVNDQQASGQRTKQQLAAMELQVADAQRQQCLLQTALNDLRRDREALLRSKTGLEADVKRLQQERLDLEAKLQLSIEDRAKKASELQHEQRMRKEREGELDSLRLASHEAQFAFQKAQETALLAESQHRKLASEIESKERQNEDLTKQLISLRQDKEQVEEELVRTRRTLDGRDGDLQAAQQHLAKKLKETARLTERVEENGQRIHELELSNEDLKKRYATIEAEADKYRKREKEIESRAEQSVLEAQAAATRWESEYGRMYTQWQQSEENNKKLRAMEVKYKQVSAVLAGLLDAPQAAAVEPTLRSSVVDQATPTAPQPPMEDQDLFSQQPQKRAKRNLFDP
ncbi:MAG: hypothetical protein Q8K75_09735 [Chlamydiales bacterium]|nr:hypothetical protein [Chlamydiales bacterium]